ncbi:hypothetical protein [Streptomyces sp. NPDC101776]|uniref:hypothetical protein n=1 Tax=Streptomyces sp. NPDC101776 TaxID=3366146 RepID=UPI00382C76F8
MAVVAALSIAMAPAAGATSDGCGDLDNGQLCIYHPAGPSGDYETRYFKNGGPDVVVMLGEQAKTPDGNVQPKDYDSTWLTAKAGRTVSKTRYLTMDKGWCIRAAMKTKSGETYIGKWYCM